MPSSSHCRLTLKVAAGSIQARLCSSEAGSFFFEPVELRLEPTDLLVELGLQGLVLSAGTLGALLEQFHGAIEKTLLPDTDHRRMDAVKRRQLVDGLVALERCQR